MTAQCHPAFQDKDNHHLICLGYWPERLISAFEHFVFTSHLQGIPSWLPERWKSFIVQKKEQAIAEAMLPESIRNRVPEGSVIDDTDYLDYARQVKQLDLEIWFNVETSRIPCWPRQHASDNTSHSPVSPGKCWLDGHTEQSPSIFSSFLTQDKCISAQISSLFNLPYLFMWPSLHSRIITSGRDKSLAPDRFEQILFHRQVLWGVWRRRRSSWLLLLKRGR